MWPRLARTFEHLIEERSEVVAGGQAAVGPGCDIGSDHGAVTPSERPGSPHSPATVSRMARPRYPKSTGPLPPPLPPATRTVGQMVAESLKLYGDRFWVVIPLGLPLVVVDQITVGQETATSIVVFALAAPFFAASYAGASALVSGRAPARRAWFIAIGVGSLVFLPAAFLLPWFSLAAVALQELFGFVVTAAV